MSGEPLKPGAFVRVDLHSDDPGATQAFYEEAFGWSFQPREGTEPLGWRAPSGPHGSLVERTGASLPRTLCHVLVESLEDHRGAVRAVGGEVLVEGAGVPGEGRFAVFRAPGGVVQALWQAEPGSGRDSVEPPETPAPGSIVHVEMHSTDRPATQRFFERLLDWSFQELEGTGYFVFTPPSPPDGGLFQRQDGPFEPPATLVYILVEGVGEALGRIRAAGGKVLGERYEIEGFGAFGVFEAPGGLVQAVWESLA